jgi:hypothetical protein
VLNRHRLDNLGEVFIHGGAILTLWQLTRLGDRQARSALPLQDQPAG